MIRMEINKIIKKQEKKLRIKRNQLQGKLGEVDAKNELIVEGYEIKRKPHGRDFDVRKVNPITGKKGKTIKVEVKTGKAKLSPLQKKTKKKNKRFKLFRSVWDV